MLKVLKQIVMWLAFIFLVMAVWVQRVEAHHINWAIVEEQVLILPGVVGVEDVPEEPEPVIVAALYETDHRGVIKEQYRMALLEQVGLTREHATAMYQIIEKESSWRPFVKNPRSSAYGLCQTMLSVHNVNNYPNFKKDPIQQLKWCKKYAHDRYGTLQNALAAHNRKGWW